MATLQYVDGMLVTWGDRLFNDSVSSRKGATKGLLREPKRRGGQGGKLKADEVRQKLRDTLNKVPEVTVKITSSGKSIKQIKNHLDYISRNGEKQLEDQDGKLIDGREAVRDLRDAWRNGPNAVPFETSNVRESFNIVLSMPPGTDRFAVHNAARDFAKLEFGGKYDFVFASHDDTKHPHAHLVVKAQGYNGKRLNPRKADLQRWRQSFASKLREHGIEANATKRPTRGVTKQSKKATLIEADRAGRSLSRFKDNSINPYERQRATIDSEVLLSFKKLAESLQDSPEPTDRMLAVGIVNFVKTMPIIEARIKGQDRVVKAARNRSSEDKEHERNK